jgi:hypothetical protein
MNEVSLYTNVPAETEEIKGVASRFTGFLNDLNTDDRAILECLKEEGGFIWKITVPGHLEAWASDVLSDVLADPSTLEVADEE